ncbi:MAG: J domain-containing protein [Myxococcota bacterium]|nr:J domain-containing protein [Myxococcota bacterium]
MARHDFYNVLGLQRTASFDEIKKAYRGLALELHPDRRPDDPRAAERFQQVKAAYETLSNPDQRMRYDRLGPFYTEDGRPPSPEELGEVLSDVLKGLFRRNKENEPGEDLKFTLRIPLHEVATGSTHQIHVPRQVRCKACQGTGAPEAGRENCPTCDGTGRSTTQRFLKQSCARCNGRGFVVKEACTLCGGLGRHGTETRIRVKVPAGVATGTQLRISGKGNEGHGRGPAGKLTVLVQVDEHPFFKRRRGEDLVCDLPISITEAALGAEREVPLLQGSTRIRIQAGTQDGELLRLTGKGLPKRGSSHRGDLFYRVCVEIPRGLNTSQQATLRAFAKNLPNDALPGRNAFETLLGEHTALEDS